MKDSELNIGLMQLVFPIMKTVDMMSPALASHHLDVAYLALRIGEEAGLPEDDIRTIVLAGLMHDIGAFSLDERLDILEFEYLQPERHCNAGYELLRQFEPFAQAAGIIRFHHTRWDNGEGGQHDGIDVPLGSHILHLADRIAVLVPKNIHALSKVAEICKKIQDLRGSWFHPEMTDAALALARRDHIWLDIVSHAVERPLTECFEGSQRLATLDELLSFGELVCQLIDFRSPFTATHTSGLAAAASALAERLEFEESQQKLLKLAAYFHDLGKLAVPTEVLEKVGQFTDDEWHTMRAHVYYTFRALSSLPALDKLTSWSALHQERLDGSGYPFGYTANRLPLGARVLAVADVFVAITEDRPYRDGMSEQEARAVLANMAARRQLDPDIVRVLFDDFSVINAIRDEAQDKARAAFQRFRDNLSDYTQNGRG